VTKVIRDVNSMFGGLGISWMAKHAAANVLSIVIVLIFTF
jgi:hypothetical protein